MTERIICAGFGGQGIVTLGKILAHTGMLEKRNVTYIPKYGAEMRGGTAHCMVIISDNLISSPLVSVPDSAIVMNLPSLLKFEESLKAKGDLFLNSSLIKKETERKDIRVIKIPATEIATKLGNKQVANMVMLGAYFKQKRMFFEENIFIALEEVLNKPELLSINKQAVKEGMKEVSEKYISDL
ncbi:MAG: 2-oxoacid:ferredoxin oxidoreductase subunit gamma [Candidatus Omnitrophica bacterium 4484_213]|nr:MAG: 2-oxoacid:ferredoxin oxidoreductase subunit gamma [Candidatus Omnitrophica bacterium 4484_213]